MSERTESLAGRDVHAALIIRTDYRDEQAWAAMKAALAEPWGDGDREPYVHVVDDPVWAGATTAEVLAVVRGLPELHVVHLADSVSLRPGSGPGPGPLLAAATLTREECESDEEYEAYGGEFRTVPAGVADIHANLMIANLDFGDFADAAREDPEGIFRSL